MFVYFFLSVFFSIFRLSLFDLIYLFSRSTHWIPLDEQSRVRKSEDFHLSGEDSPLKQRDCLGLTPKLPESHFVSRYSWGCSRVISYVQLVALAGKETLCMCVCVCVCACMCGRVRTRAKRIADLRMYTRQLWEARVTPTGPAWKREPPPRAANRTESHHAHISCTGFTSISTTCVSTNHKTTNLQLHT